MPCNFARYYIFEVHRQRCRRVHIFFERMALSGLAAIRPYSLQNPRPSPPPLPPPPDRLCFYWEKIHTTLYYAWSNNVPLHNLDCVYERLNRRIWLMVPTGTEIEIPALAGLACSSWPGWILYSIPLPPVTSQSSNPFKPVRTLNGCRYVLDEDHFSGHIRLQLLSMQWYGHQCTFLALLGFKGMYEHRRAATKGVTNFPHLSLCEGVPCCTTWQRMTVFADDSDRKHYITLHRRHYITQIMMSSMQIVARIHIWRI